MTDPLVAMEVRDDGVGLVTLQRPPVNAISSRVAREVHAIADRVTADPDVRALVVWGGPKVFAAGADIKEFPDWGHDEALAGSQVLHAAMDALAGLDAPSIAAITGYSLGGGFELALACDFRMATADARVGFPEILLGLVPGAGGTQRLLRIVGPTRAKELVFAGRMIPADEALALGLVDTVVDDADALLAAALERAAGYAAGPAAMGLAKRAIDEGSTLSLADGLALERELFADAFATRDKEIGVASFIEHGPGKATFVHE